MTPTYNKQVEDSPHDDNDHEQYDSNRYGRFVLLHKTVRELGGGLTVKGEEHKR